VARRAEGAGGAPESTSGRPLWWESLKVEGRKKEKETKSENGDGL
jgi:hypothetical protein